MNFETSISASTHSKELMIIEEIKVTVVEDGVELFVKSPVIHKWAKEVFKGEPDDLGLRTGNPLNDWDWDTQSVPINLDSSNLFWIRSKDLDTGIKFKYCVPVLAPAQLNDFIQDTCENISKAYMRYMHAGSVSGRLRVRL